MESEGVLTRAQRRASGISLRSSLIELSTPVSSPRKRRTSNSQTTPQRSSKKECDTESSVSSLAANKSNLKSSRKKNILLPVDEESLSQSSDKSSIVSSQRSPSKQNVSSNRAQTPRKTPRKAENKCEPDCLSSKSITRTSKRISAMTSENDINNVTVTETNEENNAVNTDRLNEHAIKSNSSKKSGKPNAVSVLSVRTRRMSTKSSELSDKPTDNSKTELVTNVSTRKRLKSLLEEDSKVPSDQNDEKNKSFVQTEVKPNSTDVKTPSKCKKSNTVELNEPSTSRGRVKDKSKLVSKSIVKEAETCSELKLPVSKNKRHSLPIIGMKSTGSVADRKQFWASYSQTIDCLNNLGLLNTTSDFSVKNNSTKKVNNCKVLAADIGDKKKVNEKRKENEHENKDRLDEAVTDSQDTNVSSTVNENKEMPVSSSSDINYSQESSSNSPIRAEQRSETRNENVSKRTTPSILQNESSNRSSVGISLVENVSMPVENQEIVSDHLESASQHWKKNRRKLDLIESSPISAVVDVKCETVSSVPDIKSTSSSITLEQQNESKSDKLQSSSNVHTASEIHNENPSSANKKSFEEGEKISSQSIKLTGSNKNEKKNKRKQKAIESSPEYVGIESLFNEQNKKSTKRKSNTVESSPEYNINSLFNVQNKKIKKKSKAVRSSPENDIYSLFNKQNKKNIRRESKTIESSPEYGIDSLFHEQSEEKKKRKLNEVESFSEYDIHPLFCEQMSNEDCEQMSNEEDEKLNFSISQLQTQTSSLDNNIQCDKNSSNSNIRYITSGQRKLSQSGNPSSSQDSIQREISQPGKCSSNDIPLSSESKSVSPNEISQLQDEQSSDIKISRDSISDLPINTLSCNTDFSIKDDNARNSVSDKISESQGSTESSEIKHVNFENGLKSKNRNSFSLVASKENSSQNITSGSGFNKDKGNLITLLSNSSESSSSSPIQAGQKVVQNEADHKVTENEIYTTSSSSDTSDITSDDDIFVTQEKNIPLPKNNLKQTSTNAAQQTVKVKKDVSSFLTEKNGFSQQNSKKSGFHPSFIFDSSKLPLSNKIASEIDSNNCKSKLETNKSVTAPSNSNDTNKKTDKSEAPSNSNDTNIKTKKKKKKKNKTETLMQKKPSSKDLAADFLSLNPNESSVKDKNVDSQNVFIDNKEDANSNAAGDKRKNKKKRKKKKKNIDIDEMSTMNRKDDLKLQETTMNYNSVNLSSQFTRGSDVQAQLKNNKKTDNIVKNPKISESNCNNVQSESNLVPTQSGNTSRKKGIPKKVEVLDEKTQILLEDMLIDHSNESAESDSDAEQRKAIKISAEKRIISNLSTSESDSRLGQLLNKEPETHEDSDGPPEVVSFEKSRTEVLESLKKRIENIQKIKRSKRKKRKERFDLLERLREEKLNKLKEQKAMEDDASCSSSEESIHDGGFVVTAMNSGKNTNKKVEENLPSSWTVTDTDSHTGSIKLKRQGGDNILKNTWTITDMEPLTGSEGKRRRKKKKKNQAGNASTNEGISKKSSILKRLPEEVLQNLPHQVPVKKPHIAEESSKTEISIQEKTNFKQKRKKATKEDVYSKDIKTDIDYIPLSSKSSTQFNVMPLDSINYASMSLAERAVEFRKRMLYGTDRHKMAPAKSLIDHQKKLKAARMY